MKQLKRTRDSFDKKIYILALFGVLCFRFITEFYDRGYAGYFSRNIPLENSTFAVPFFGAVVLILISFFLSACMGEIIGEAKDKTFLVFYFFLFTVSFGTLPYLFSESHSLVPSFIYVVFLFFMVKGFVIAEIIPVSVYCLLTFIPTFLRTTFVTYLPMFTVLFVFSSGVRMYVLLSERKKSKALSDCEKKAVALAVLTAVICAGTYFYVMILEKKISAPAENVFFNLEMLTAFFACLPVIAANFYGLLKLSAASRKTQSVFTLYIIAAVVSCFCVFGQYTKQWLPACCIMGCVALCVCTKIGDESSAAVFKNEERFIKNKWYIIILIMSVFVLLMSRHPAYSDYRLNECILKYFPY